MQKGFDLLALALAIVGAVNWGLVGLFQFDLVATLAGLEFGQVNLVSQVIYGLVGLAGLYLISFLPRVLARETASRPVYS